MVPGAQSIYVRKLGCFSMASACSPIPYRKWLQQNQTTTLQVYNSQHYSGVEARKIYSVKHFVKQDFSGRHCDKT